MSPSNPALLVVTQRFIDKSRTKKRRFQCYAIDGKVAVHISDNRHLINNISSFIYSAAYFVLDSAVAE